MKKSKKFYVEYFKNGVLKWCVMQATSKKEVKENLYFYNATPKIISAM